MWDEGVREVVKSTGERSLWRAFGTSLMFSSCLELKLSGGGLFLATIAANVLYSDEIMRLHHCCKTRFWKTLGLFIVYLCIFAVLSTQVNDQSLYYSFGTFWSENKEEKGTQTLRSATGYQSCSATLVV